MLEIDDRLVYRFPRELEHPKVNAEALLAVEVLAVTVDQVVHAI